MLYTCPGMHYSCRELLQAVIRRMCYGAVAGGGLYADWAGALLDLNERALTLRIKDCACLSCNQYTREPALTRVCACAVSSRGLC